MAVGHDVQWWFHMDVNALTPNIERDANAGIVNRTAFWLGSVLGGSDD
jgi:hypothetical protein